MNSSEFDWITRKPRECFGFNGHLYDVSAAKTIIAAEPRDIGELRVADLMAIQNLYEDTGDSLITTDEARVATLTASDLQFPVIVVNYKGRKLVIDGWHRLTRAEQLRIEYVPAAQISDAELQSIHQFRISKQADISTDSFG